ncbi:hypothetical protein M433DRAFT_142455 [Acidomyces richmondensis BFW]|nr:hypothetical protein M433DRAFT_142455 [Acidomyces richmondensis BFW]
MVQDLSPAKCVLLTAHYASEANIRALQSFTPSRSDTLTPELILRILLTFLPETTEPREYAKYVEDVASQLYHDYEQEGVEVDLGPVKNLTDKEAEKKRQRLRMCEIKPPMFPPDAPDDLLTRFLCHRAYRINEAMGSLKLVQELIEPFLAENNREYLRLWYVSLVLPLFRREEEYYPPSPAREDDVVLKEVGLNEFEAMREREGTDFLLQRALESMVANSSTINSPSQWKKGSAISRDVKGMVGPWMYGHTERKRRKLRHGRFEENGKSRHGTKDLEQDVIKIQPEGAQDESNAEHAWQYVYNWMVQHAVNHFPLITICVEEWEGPSDVDLGGFVSKEDYLDDELRRDLDLQYAQAVLATCYAAAASTYETIHCAHRILARLAAKLDFIPPPDLDIPVESLPKLERNATRLDECQTIADLEPSALLKPDHPLTKPCLETYMLLQMIVYSAHQFSSLGIPISLFGIAKLHFVDGRGEQLAALRQSLRGLTKQGVRREGDEIQWEVCRAKLIWLWGWGIQPDFGDPPYGTGVLGKIDRRIFEEEMLKCFVENETQWLSKESVEDIVLQKAMEAYDGASNGNRTRGGVKRASDIISAFRPYFHSSQALRQVTALIAATHALSFYSLTLQHGVPFQPVSIRVSSDPIGLIEKVLEQNARSYTKLDDLIEIAQNLVTAGLTQGQERLHVSRGEKCTDDDALTRRMKEAQRRVTFMAVEAALRENDFETAYSYITSRLTPSGAEITSVPQENSKSKKHKRFSSKGSIRSSNEHDDDDISWRAAFLAGRYRPAASSPPTLRRLEQRTELLSLALLLAPRSMLTEILASWRRCEEETSALIQVREQAEEDFDDWADKRTSRSVLPGNFTSHDEEPDIIRNQTRREFERIPLAKGSVGDEAPMSMFDLTRSAARAIRRNAFPLHGVTSASRGSPQSVESERGQRESVESLSVRKRDMVASAVSEGLASGLGWVLGATPVKDGELER